MDLDPIAKAKICKLLRNIQLSLDLNFRRDSILPKVIIPATVQSPIISTSTDELFRIDEFSQIHEEEDEDKEIDILVIEESSRDSKMVLRSAAAPDVGEENEREHGGADDREEAIKKMEKRNTEEDNAECVVEGKKTKHLGDERIEKLNTVASLEDDGSEKCTKIARTALPLGLCLYKNPLLKTLGLQVQLTPSSFLLMGPQPFIKPNLFPFWSEPPLSCTFPSIPPPIPNHMGLRINLTEIQPNSFTDPFLENPQKFNLPIPFSISPIQVFDPLIPIPIPPKPNLTFIELDPYLNTPIEYPNISLLKPILEPNFMTFNINSRTRESHGWEILICATFVESIPLIPLWIWNEIRREFSIGVFFSSPGLNSRSSSIF